MTATKIQPGDDLHLTSLMAPHSLNFVTGPDRAALLAYGRDVFAAAREVTVERYEIPGGMRSALEDVISYLRSHGRCDLVRLMQELYTAISPWDGGSCSDVPDALVPARPDAEYLLSIAQNHRWPMLMRAHIKAAAQLTTAPALEAPAAPSPWADPVRDLLGHLSDVLDDEAFGKIDTARWNAVSALIGATQAAPAAPAVDAETVKKAARYDWLRGSNVANGTVLAEHFGGSRMQDFDAVIDAKIAAQAKEGSAAA